MNVLLITKTLNKGGAARGANNLLNALKSAGANVVALDANASKAGCLIGALRSAERIYERLAHDSGTHCIRLGPPIFNLKALYDQHRPDVIQLCDVSGNTIRFTDIPRVPCPVVHRMSDFWPYHGAHHYAEQPPARPDFADRLLRYLVYDGRAMPDCRVAPSQWLAALLGGRNIEIIRNAVTIPENVRPPGPHKGVLKFGFISGHLMDPRKGFKTLPPFLEALRRLNGREIELHTFGRTLKEPCPEIANVKVISHPPFKPSELSQVYKMFDILLCPSRQDNSPNVVTEALAHGVPVIAQSGTGMDSYVTEAFGRLVDFHGSVPSNCADAVERLVAGYADASAAARSYATQYLSPDKIGNDYLSLYRKLLSGRQ